MFSRMLLHVGKTLFPVDGRVNGASHLQRRVRLMNNHAMFLLHMCHMHFPDPSGVRRLSAALRVKSALIQNDMKTFFCFSALQDFGCKFFFISLSSSISCPRTEKKAEYFLIFSFFLFSIYQNAILDRAMKKHKSVHFFQYFLIYPFRFLEIKVCFGVSAMSGAPCFA